MILLRLRNKNYSNLKLKPKKKVLLKIKSRIIAFVQRFKELQGSPSYLARGTVVGVFVGFAPVMPLKTMMILAITVSIPSSTVAAILVCTIICNPFTYLPLYFISWKIGDVLLPGRASWTMLEQSVKQMQQSSLSESVILIGQIGIDTIIVVLVGGCLLALPLAIISYPLAYRMFVKIAKKKQGRQVE